jgi:hypothetical protein
MEQEAEKLDIHPFPLAELQSKKIQHHMFLREQWCESILIRSDLTYPTSVQDMVQLLIDIGILIEVNHRETTYLDLILKPFPRPEESLLLTSKENDQAIKLNAFYFHKEDFVNG